MTPRQSVTAFLAPLQPILQAITAAGGRPLLVGGAVRDWLLGQDSSDFDLEVYDLDVEKLLVVLKRFGRVDVVGRSFGVLKMRLQTRQLDISLPQQHSLNASSKRGQIVPAPVALTPREAAARRDFTCNALMLTPEGELLDFFGGEQDLQNRVIRHTSAAFADDPLRVLRAMQLASRLNMTLAPETADLARSLLPLAATLPVERVWGEWLKWSLGEWPAAGLRVLDATDWLRCYPELQVLVGCEQDAQWHPEGDVWVHTKLVCAAAAQIAVRDGLAEGERTVLLLAALCHDLGKPATTVHSPDGRIRSPRHDQEGVAPTQNLLARIGCPRSISAQVVPLVREHMSLHGAQPTPRVVRRLAVRLAPATITTWARLVEADHSGRPPLPASAPGTPFLQLAESLAVSHGRPTPLVQGRDLMAVGYPAGPTLGTLLRHAYAAQVDGAFATLQEGIAWVEQHATESA